MPTNVFHQTVTEVVNDSVNISSHVTGPKELEDRLQSQLNHNKKLQKRRNWISRGRTSRKR